MLEPKTVSTSLLSGKLSMSQLANLEEISMTGHFNNLIEDIENDEAKWLNFFDHAQAETCVPEPWNSGDDISVTNENARQLKKLMIIKIMRPDRMLSGVSQFLEKTLGNEIMSIQQVNLMEFVGSVSPKSPLLLVSAAGFDASYRVD